MEQQKLYSKVRQAIEAYDMIQDGDKIAVGISGGKDSLTLLLALAGLQKFYPKPFTMEAITVHTGIEGMDFTPVQALCEKLQVPYTIVETDIYGIVTERNEKSLCPLCAKLRKGAFNERALLLGCNKIAYAHHKDDVIETFLMSLALEGRIHTFSPVTHLDETGLTLIRPLVYVTESEVKGFTKRYELPVVKNLCPADSATKRESAKKLLDAMETEFPKAKSRIFASIKRDHIAGW
ncbi:MAG: ATP-binding protein [Wujia sp.]